ncbi:hypothetical protein [Streptomyces sp. NPDC046979]|uniref:hypothetical protein n=1 Tax=Streptomyces sp. NPDC046979 TaxID=3154604 RepID=UPI00340297F9
MLTPNSPQRPRHSWPYVVAAALALAFQQGWSASEVITLVTCLLVLIALITSAGQGQ